ncbi:MAG: antitoxin VapB family protein [Promethearchaeia archaeon]
MVSKQISIRKKIYDRLKGQKRENESFSDVIARLLDSQSNFSDIKECFGLSKNLPEELTDKFRESNKEMRNMIKERIGVKNR